MAKDKPSKQNTETDFGDEFSQAGYKITAKVVDRDQGMRVYENIRMVRVVSHDHTLLIMEDFMPVIGEVTKSVELVFENNTVAFEPIEGFYMHRQNEFYLLIAKHGEAEKKAVLSEEDYSYD